jgi:putative aminopeptidase FrvX
LISVPNRYMHSPNELVSRADLEQAARLIAAFVRSWTPGRTSSRASVDSIGRRAWPFPS